MATAFITPEGLLAHWQAHRRLTRKVIDAFPADQLFTFSIGGMRSFGVLATEMLHMAEPMLRGTVTGEWAMPTTAPSTKADLIAAWDASTPEIDALFARIAPERFLETMTAFGQYTAPLHDLLLYVIDNEIHHRGQGTVYLRALGIAPPQFFDRG